MTAAPPGPFDPMGRALLDHLQGFRDATYRVHCEGDAEPESVRAAVFFRDVGQMERWELLALDACRGRVLDVGAGAGCHALELERRGHAVMAIDDCALAVEVMGRRGVADPRRARLDQVADGPFDTLLLLMHGAGLAGDAAGLAALLGQADRLLGPGGQLLVDSCGPEVGGSAGLAEARLTLEYDGVLGPSFSWLFLRARALADHAGRVGLQLEVLHREPDGRYLARLTRRIG